MVLHDHPDRGELKEKPTSADGRRPGRGTPPPGFDFKGSEEPWILFRYRGFSASKMGRAAQKER